MSAESRVKLYFTISSESDVSLDILNRELGHIPPTKMRIKGEPAPKTNSNAPKRWNRYTKYEYLYQFEKVFDIDTCHEFWMNHWREEAETLQKLVRVHGYSVELDYDIIKLEDNLPSLYFPAQFNELLGKIGASCSLTVWEK